MNTVGNRYSIDMSPRQQRLHDDLLAKQNKLQKARPFREEMMESFRERSLKTINTLALDKVSHDMNMDSKKVGLSSCFDRC